MAGWLAAQVGPARDAAVRAELRVTSCRHAGYARSASTVFISEDSIRRGWETVRARYTQKYSDRRKMRTLSFSDIEINLLSPDVAVVLGRWRLERAKDRPHGRFTLIFKRLPEGWRIVHDHTSAARP